ncbi:MAG: hypothetical protein A3I61_16745 [Acidobacteria bacterium RIFCSPLOWO2_02_FULL_68_18]|nr:MAG: hypothetical protein A3I61_16745 [Acidobacteria bacterium RIFCSPLOWO2_02_FULL_68_18]OFW50107.1 MAG: hypothetical protein A3G77_09125 [Acidobacteria bacterium RIFCSPLOWO2_12_FULL_68_19]
MTRRHLVCAGLSILLGAGVAAQRPGGNGGEDGAESRDMRLVGHHDLQGRSAYQPEIKRQGDRWIAYVGHHGGNARNPLTGREEPNGTSILDVTDPRNPVYLAHIPGQPLGKGEGAESGGAQMARVCSGATLPRGDRNKFYLLRAYGNTADSAHEMWDVTDPATPARITVIVSGLRGTHKNWWECDTGIAYLVSGQPGWRVPRMVKIYDLSDPAKPVFIRDFGLPGQQPGSTGTPPGDNGLHGPVSTGPQGNRVYFSYGYVKEGVVQIVDREKLLKGPAEPTEANLLYPQISRMDLPPSVGAHNVFPLLRMPIAEFAKEQERTRDMLVIIDEAVGRDCSATARAMMWMADITTETRPFGVANWTVPEASGHFCGRGAGRFGTHSTHENFTPIYYNRIMFVAHFNAGVRAVDVRDPFHPTEIAYYIPAQTATTMCAPGRPGEPCVRGIQTNNVEVDDRGYVYGADRAGTGLHILELTGAARSVANFR